MTTIPKKKSGEATTYDYNLKKKFGEATTYDYDLKKKSGESTTYDYYLEKKIWGVNAVIQLFNDCLMTDYD